MAKKKSSQLLDSAKEGLLSILRLVVLTVVSTLLLEGVIDVLLSLIDVSLDPTLKLAIIFGTTFFLKGVDKLLHEQGKNTDNKSLSKGLTRF
jgi:hypothetical protein